MKKRELDQLAGLRDGTPDEGYGRKTITVEEWDKDKDTAEYMDDDHTFD